jgi:hypothetical protein
MPAAAQQNYDKASSRVPGATASQMLELSAEKCVTGCQYDVAVLHVDTSLTAVVEVPFHDKCPEAELWEEEILHTAEGPQIS